MRVIKDTVPATDKPHALLIALPGAGDRAQDLIDQQFVRALRQRELPVDVFAVDVPMDDYLDGNVAGHLADQLITPARDAGWGHIWLMGVSLGGMGALTYMCQHPGDIAGVILIAPFLGTRGLLAEVGHAGGLEAWQPGTITERDDERRLMTWLKHASAGELATPPVFLGYGHDDRFAAASRLLSQRLPAERVMTIPGGHDWPTWHALWCRILDHPSFTFSH
jgi:pimeloyl-ACP methyl ester carboxylesterase